MNQDTAVQWLGYAIIALPVLVVGGGLLWRLFRKDKADSDRALFLQGVHVAYGIVNNIAALTPNKVDDKAAEFLKQLETYLTPKGIELTPVMKQEATMIADAIHGNQKAADAPTSPS